MEKISRTKIVDLLKRRDFGAMVNVKGWVRTRRGSKQVNFIALNDGSTINNVQIVVDLANFDEEMLKQITTGACISVNGELTESIGSGQAAEVQARGIEVLGTCDNTYPLQKKGHTMEFLREIAHLRPRTNTFGAVFRIRHNMAIAIHKFFHERGFFYFHTPIITASDCEGAGQMFQVTTKNLYDLKKDENGSIIYDDDFFGKQASLTVSGQLEGELAATALGAIYLDLGYDTVRKVLLEIIVPYIEDESISFFHDYKSALQEFIQTEQRTLQYKVIKEEGPPHQRTFTVQVSVDDIIYGTGSANSKKEAEQEAARSALEKLAR